MINLRAKKVGVFTDSTLVHLAPVKAVLDSLARNQVNYVVYDQVRVEPTDQSFQAAAEFAKREGLDTFLAVGGGSVMDTAKAANLYSSDPSAEFLDYVNAPIGAGKPVMCELKPLVAVPTTSGTGSETTGVAVFDYEPLQGRNFTLRFSWLRYFLNSQSDQTREGRAGYDSPLSSQDRHRQPGPPASAGDC